MFFFSLLFPVRKTVETGKFATDVVSKGEGQTWGSGDKILSGGSDMACCPCISTVKVITRSSPPP